MIITALIELILNVLGALLVFDLPALPESVISILDNISGYLVSGVGILRAFVGDGCMTILATLFGLVVLANAAYFLYSFVFFVIRKIPMLNVKE